MIAMVYKCPLVCLDHIYTAINLVWKNLLSFFSEMCQLSDPKSIFSQRALIDVFCIKISSKSIQQFSFNMYLSKKIPSCHFFFLMGKWKNSVFPDCLILQYFEPETQD